METLAGFTAHRIQHRVVCILVGYHLLLLVSVAEVVAEHAFVDLLGAWVHELRSCVHHRALIVSWRLILQTRVRLIMEILKCTI
jgi:hypothetical protein